MGSPIDINTGLAAAEAATASSTVIPPNVAKLTQQIQGEESALQFFQAAFMRANPGYGGGRFIPFVNFSQRRPLSSLNSTSTRQDDSSWEVRAFAEDTASDDGLQWPPRSYSCSFCGREFCTAQALGGHMNVHRRQRALMRAAASANAAEIIPSPSSSSTSPAPANLSPPSDHNINSNANQGLPAPAMGYCFLYPAPPAANYHPNPTSIPLQTEIDSTKPALFSKHALSTSLSLAPYNPLSADTSTGGSEQSNDLRSLKRAKLDGFEPILEQNKGLGFAAPKEMCKQKVDLDLRLGPINGEWQNHVHYI